MPTLGYIIDSANDRYSDFLHTLPVVKRRRRCAHCGREFESDAELSAHVGLEHPLEVPSLYVLGRHSPRTLTIRHPLVADAFALLNCSACSAETGGRIIHIPPENLPAWLADERPSHVRLTLTNARQPGGEVASTEVRLEFSLASEEDLNRCDRAFVSVLASPCFGMDEVQAFLGSLPHEGPSHDYAAALADYAVGVLLKDQEPGSGVLGEFHEFKEKFMSSLAILSDMARPVAEAVSAAIAFNLNAWDQFDPPPQSPRLFAAAEFFGALRGQAGDAIAPPLREAATAAICPVDRMTNDLLAAIPAASSVRPGSRIPSAVQVALDDDQRRGVSEYDLVKRNVIRALVALRLRDSEGARRTLSRLRHDHYFGVWAEQRLQELSANG